MSEEDRQDFRKLKVYVPPSKRRQQDRDEIEDALDEFYEERELWAGTQMSREDEQ